MSGPRHLSGMRPAAIAIALALVIAAPLPAQGPPPVAAVAAKRPSPLGYFFRSLLVPGWGQAAMDRKLTGGIFVAFEGLALGMALKAHRELRYLEETNSERIEDKRSERQDWLVLMAFNHLMSGLEAYVSANLYDFPGDLNARVLPDGRTGFGVTLPMPRP